MPTKVLHFIEKDEKQRKVEKTISDLINKEPSNYVSHDVSSFSEDSHTWNVTRLQLKNVTKIKTNQKDSDIEKARQKEGLLVFGSGPNLNDGTGRVIFSTVKRNQLKLSHLEALTSGGFVYQKERFQSTYSDRCFSVGKDLFHYTPGFETTAAFQCHRSHSHWMGTHTIDRDENGSTIRGKLEVTMFYLYGSDAKINMITPETNFVKHFKIELHQLKPSWCGCMLGVMVSRVKITAIETIECIIPHDEGYGYKEEVREVTLQDKKFETRIMKFDMNGDHDDRYFKLHVNHFNCTLPNLGVTFFSKNCSRTYALRFSVTLTCLEKKCTSTFNVTLNVAVVSKESAKLNEVENGLFKKRDYPYIQRFPKTEAVAQDIDEWVRKKALAIGNLTLNSHICAIPGDGVIFGIITISQFCHDIQTDGSTSLIVEEDEDNAVDPPVDYTDAIVYCKSSIWFRSKDMEVQLNKSCYFSPAVVNYLEQYRPDGDRFRLGWRSTLFVGESLGNATSWLSLNKKERSVYVKKINISFVEITQRNEGESHSYKVNTLTVVDKKYGRFQGVPLNIKNGRADFPKELLDGVWPELNPTVVTNLFSRENFLEIRLEIKTSFASTEHVGLNVRCFNIGDYEALVASSSLPPYQDKDEKLDEKQIEKQLDVKQTEKEGTE